jgi:hypothetical protein
LVVYVKVCVLLKVLLGEGEEKNMKSDTYKKVIQIAGSVLDTKMK